MAHLSTACVLDSEQTIGDVHRRMLFTAGARNLADGFHPPANLHTAKILEFISRVDQYRDPWATGDRSISAGIMAILRPRRCCFIGVP